MNYAELLQAWRAGTLPARNLVGTRREAPEDFNYRNLPALPVLTAIKTKVEQKTNPTPKHAHADAKECPPVQHLVQCRQCQHFKPNANNPAQGLGRCGAEDDRLPWSTAPKPSAQDLIEICQTACQGTEIDPRDLRDWLIKQSDPDWLCPQAVAAWVRCIAKYGYPETAAS